MTVGYRLYYQCLPKNTQLASCCVMFFDGFKYAVNRKNASGKIYWRCAVNRQCGGSVTTEDGVL